VDLQLDALLAANAHYRRSAFAAAPRTPQPSRRLVILTCMDARLDLFRSLGLEVGDAHILRNAGGRATADAIRSLVVSAHLLGTREIGVIHHTNCGLEGITDEEVARRTGVAGVAFHAFDEIDQSVRDDVAEIRACGHLPDGFAVWGAVYDVDTGEVRIVEPPERLAARPQGSDQPILRVLVVDDDDGFLELLQRAIGRISRFQIDGAASHGAEAIELAAARKPDLIVLDRKMPVLDGLGALPELRRLSPGSRIVMYAADVDDDFRLQAIAAGADGVVSKLQPIGALFEAMDRAVGAI
jgi:carbonic anhydrase